VEHFEKQIGGFCTYRDFHRWLVPMLPMSGVRYVELGPAWGQGVAHLAVELVNSGRTDARIDMVDIGDAETLRRNLAPVASVIGDIWTENSWEAARHYADETFDCVFVDANHSKRCVLDDIAAWRRKVKRGGWLAGHDHAPYDNLGGVIEAVAESFHRYHIMRCEPFSDGKLFPTWFTRIGENGQEID
jgi:hypothetical protein